MAEEQKREVSKTVKLKKVEEEKKESDVEDRLSNIEKEIIQLKEELHKHIEWHEAVKGPIDAFMRLIQLVTGKIRAI